MNHPIYSIDQLSTLGMSYAHTLTLCRQGHWERLRSGLFSPHMSLSPHEYHIHRVDALLHRLNPSSVLSHVSAGVLHGLPLPDARLETLTITRRSGAHGERRSDLKYSASALDEDECMILDGRPVTTLARTATDLARLLPFEWGVAVCDAVLRGGLTGEELIASLTRHKGLKGLSRAWSVVRFADARAESPCESLSRVHILRAGLPAPELQYELRDRYGNLIARCDFAWPEFGLIGEADGVAKYVSLAGPHECPEDAIVREKRRDERIRQEGWWVTHWGWKEAVTPGALASLLSQAIRVARTAS